MDNIRTKDRDDADIDLAAREISGVLHPRNILTDPSGNDLTPLTDAQLRAAPVAVSGTFWQATQPVSIASWGGLTDTQLRDAPVPVSASSLPLPSGAATESTLDARTGALTETAPASDTASSGINGRLQRIAQRLTSLIALLPASLGTKAGSASLSVVEAQPTAAIVSLQTNATGSTYNAFSSQPCDELDIVNTDVDAVDLEVRRGSSGNTIVVPAGSSRMFIGLTNASGLEVRRLDQSNTQITFTAEAITK